MNLFEAKESLKNGGEWLSAARQWMQSNVRGGDTMLWSDTTLVSIPFCQLEQLALHAASGALSEHTTKKVSTSLESSYINSISSEAFHLMLVMLTSRQFDYIEYGEHSRPLGPFSALRIRFIPTQEGYQFSLEATDSFHREGSRHFQPDSQIQQLKIQLALDLDKFREKKRPVGQRLNFVKLDFFLGNDPVSEVSK